MKQRLELTRAGQQVRKLVYIDQSLRGIEGPKALSAMSPDMVERLRAERDNLCASLGIPDNPKERSMIIGGFKGRLIQLGFPHWKINP